MSNSDFRLHLEGKPVQTSTEELWRACATWIANTLRRISKAHQVFHNLVCSLDSAEPNNHISHGQVSERE